MNIKRRIRNKDNTRALRRRPINLLASFMTTMNLYCGTFSIFASIGGEYERAAVYILAAIIFDMLDGAVARITRSTSEFGKELDSICDVVSFGLAPGILLFTLYLPEAAHFELSERAESIVGMTGSYVAIIFVICTALRLARFNTFQADRRDYFIGLPSPAAGGTLAAYVLFLHYVEPRLDSHEIGVLAYYSLGPLALLLAFLMVSTVRYPKDRFKAFIVAPRHAIIALATYAFLIAVLHYAWTTSPAMVLFPLAAAYVLFGMIGEAWVLLQRRGLPSKTTTPEENVSEATPATGISKAKSEVENVEKEEKNTTQEQATDEAEQRPERN